MLKSLEISAYQDGYNISQIDCINLPIAGAAGSFKHENYHYFCFYQCLLDNWTDMSDGSFITSKSYIFEKLGLSLKTYQATTAQEFVKIIKSSIDNRNPAFILVKYNTLFYYKEYKNENYQSNHTLLISGYDAEKEIIVIREFSHIRQAIWPTISADILCELRLTNQMLIDIWEKSNKALKKEDKSCYQSVFVVETSGSYRVNNIVDLLRDTLEICNVKKSRLIELVNQYNQIHSYFKNDRFNEQIRRALHGSVHVLFNVIERAPEFSKIDEGFKVKFGDLKEKFIKYRYQLLSRLNIEALRGTRLDSNAKQDLIYEIKVYDQEFFNLLNELSNKLESNVKTGLKERQLKNHALNAVVTASSQSLPASNVIDGKWQEIVDAWLSTKVSPPHWLMLDLGEVKKVDRIVVRHFNNDEFITIDYDIQGSNDQKKWENIVAIKNNELSENMFEIASSYRYFRLYITCPCSRDYCARIQEMELWGL